MFTSTRLIHIDTEAIFDMIHPLAAFENCHLSLEDFKRAAAGEIVEGATEEEMLLAKNMEAACIYMLDSLSQQVDVEYAYKINEILTNARISGDQMRDFDISMEDLEIVKILRDCKFDLSGYDLSELIPEIPKRDQLDRYMNISEEEYLNYINDPASRKYEKFAYDCFMPMIRDQYFKKSNIITGAFIVCKLVLQAKGHLMFIECRHSQDLARILLDCITKKEDLRFQEFVQIMVDHHIKMNTNSNVRVMIHY